MTERGAGTGSNRELLERMLRLLMVGDVDGVAELLDPDFTQEIPQSGERVRGIANYTQLMKNYPRPPGEGPTPRPVFAASDPHIVAPEPHYVMTPTFNVVKVEGSGDELVAYARSRYPDGSWWYTIHLVTFRNHKVLRQVSFFAAPFDPPAWRSEWVERMSPPNS